MEVFFRLNIFYQNLEIIAQGRKLSSLKSIDFTDVSGFGKIFGEILIKIDLI
ncbi:MAG: hypothetical protein R6W78_17845 [Bacteroidales bacterium]